MAEIPLFPSPPTGEEAPQGSHLKGWAIFIGKIGKVIGGLTGRKEAKVVGDIATKVGQIRGGE